MTVTEFATQIIEAQKQSDNHIDWEISQAIKNLTNDQMVELAPAFDEWNDTGTETQDRIQKIISGQHKVYTMANLKSSFHSFIQDTVRFLK